MSNSERSSLESSPDRMNRVSVSLMLVLGGQGIPLRRGDIIYLMARWPYCIALQYLLQEHQKITY